jgi:hypothetical protein
VWIENIPTFTHKANRTVAWPPGASHLSEGCAKCQNTHSYGEGAGKPLSGITGRGGSVGGLIGDHDDLIVHAVPNCKEKMAGKAYIDYMIGTKQAA